MTVTFQQLHDVEQSVGMEYCFQQGWTDGLPVVPPTDRLVSRFLAEVGFSGSEVIGEVAPRGVAITAEKLAANAVMAGCLPEHMPVVVAAMRAMTDPTFNLHATSSSTGGAAHLLVVNGPIAKTLEINAGSNVFGQGFRANATIGRSVQLALRNVFKAIPGQLDRSTMGTPGKFTMCIAEREDFSPWETLSESRGFGADENVVTAFATECPHYIFNYLSNDPVGILTSIAYKMAAFANYHDPHGPSENVIALCPEHVRTIGKWSKADVQEFLFDHAVRSAADLKRAGKMLGDIEPGDEDRMIPLVDERQLISLVVAGGDAGGISCHVAGWAGGRMSRSVSRKIVM